MQVQGHALSSTSLYFEKYFFPHKKYLLQVPSNLQLLLLLLLQMWLLSPLLIIILLITLQLAPLAPLPGGGPALLYTLFICFAFAVLSPSYLSLSSLNYSRAALGSSSRPTKSHAESTIASPFFFFFFWEGLFFLSVCMCVLLLLPFSWGWVLNTTFELLLLLLLS